MNLDVVLVTHNSAGHVSRALEALPDGVDVFVVDNASADASANIAEEYGATVVRSEVNAGFAAGCNRGAALGHAKVILFLNPDAVVEPAALARLMDAFYDDPQMAVASPRLLHDDGSKQRVQWPYPSAVGAWREAFGLRPALDGVNEGFVVGACFAVRRKAFEAVGGFDERFWLYGEEADLCRRIEDLGWTVRRVPSAVAHHVGGASGGDDDVSSALVGEHFMRGGEHFVAKHGGRGALVSYRAANLVGSLGRGLLGAGRRPADHRRRAVRLARAVATGPSRVALDSPAMRVPGKGLVVCSLEAWDTTWRRNQFFVRELLAADPDLRVLFVEPPFDVVHETRRGSKRRHVSGLRPVDEDGRIVRFEPVKWLPRKLGPEADRLRDAQVRDAVAQLGFVAPRLWVNDPSYATLADAVDWPAIYDITDDWTEAGDERTRAAARRNEARLFDRCERIVVCSEGLAATKALRRDDVVVIPNAVDVEFFQHPQPRPADLPAGPTAVYVGTLHTDRLDVDLVCRLAEGLDEVSVVLVGPDALDERSRARLDAAGVVRLGARAHAEVPGYLHAADVVIIPHVVSPFTDSLDPIKLYECLAVGVPTVATRVAGFRDAGAPVRVAAGSEFVDAVRAVITDPLEPAPQRVPTWSDRAAQFGVVLAEAATARADAPSRPRVAFFDHTAVLSGGELAMARTIPALSDVDASVILGEEGPLVEVLADRGVSVEVLAVDERLNNIDRYEALNALTAWHTLWATHHAVRMLWHRLRVLHPDVLHTNSLKSNLLGGVAGRLAGVPVVWHVRDRIADDYMPANTARLIRAAARVLPTAVITNSATTKATLGRADAVVIPSPVEITPDVPHEYVHDDGRPLQVVMVGRLAPWKGQQVFLRAFAQAFDAGEAEAVIVGDALFGEVGHRDALEKLVADLGIEDRVRFAGHVADVQPLLADADIFVHASVVAEPFGQVVVEAMAMGVPVIAAAAGGPAEVVTDGVDGLLTPPGDVDALSDALRRLAAEPELRERLGGFGRLRAADFTPAVVAEKLGRLYDSLVHGRR